MTILWLAAAVAVVMLSRHRIANACALVLAMVAGTTFPDVDFFLPLDHRSGLTHSILPLLLLAYHPRLRGVVAGLAIGIGLHLAADCFPNGMRGYATIKLPFAGSIGSSASYLWLGLNALAALGIGAAIAAHLFDRLMLAVTAIAVAGIAVAYLAVTDGGWPPLALFAAAGWLTHRRRVAA
ncbi:metal-dependent hydrolase [Sphingomonas qomolangmaensis]|uniref:Metal-dependent hydrolase n=1 Tax=Sphingomonas qomolangmaensis TaxID=2918765 RepID=A0ABY5LA41_9SPHN|nr:metal-dependent hydrolase [Sphingomonas qomolangmaensis]UUL82604.1 metal-dependent hydrolase [Sphingomonas qomolangmaensis]